MTTATSSRSPARSHPTPRQLADAIRILTIDAVERAGTGHPGMPMGMADAAVALFGSALKFDPAAPDWPDRDRFVLSAGHGSMLLYSALYLTGYPGFDRDTLQTLRRYGSLAAGHPELAVAHGIETTTGPLGQGIATAVGMALGERMLNARYGDPLVDHFTYVVASDGDLMEGLSHECCSLAGHLGLGRLIVLYDDNDITIDGPIDLAYSEDVTKRFEAYGWEVDLVDGHDHDAIVRALAKAKTTLRPTLIRCKTTIGWGAPTKAGSPASHSGALGPEEVAGTRVALDWQDDAFDVPEEIEEAWEQFAQPGASARNAWQRRLEATDQATRRDFEQALEGALPPDLDAIVADLKREARERDKAEPTRFSSGRVLERLVPAVPTMIGGSGDLTPANNTRTGGQGAVSRSDFAGSYIHYGVREHAMAAIMNGLALHGGWIPYAGTFLAFTDYMRPAIRLGALMEQRVVHVMTHDSIGLGEDGPTHQPIEHLASLRAMPNIRVFRPADAVEVAECWGLALRHEGPSILALSRQEVNLLRREEDEENLSSCGAYVLAEAAAPHRATLLATGTEVGLALAAREVLEAAGVGTRVVSMPCLELFEAQSASYRKGVLGESVVRIAIEAAARNGWDRYHGDGGAFIGMSSFGASAPAAVLYELFGITAEAIVAAVRQRL